MTDYHVAPEGADHLAWGDIRLWLVLGLAVIFFLLGWLFIFSPEAGALLFGLPAPVGNSLGFVAALGIRDVILGCYIAAFAFHSSRRSVALLLLLSALIPVGDVLLVASVEGFSSILNLLLHAAAGGALASVGIVLWRHRPPE